MRRKFYTIFILPHSQARFRKLHLSRGFVLVVAVAALALAAGGLLAPHLLLRLRKESDKVARLELNNRRLAEEKRNFEVSLNDFARRLDAFEGRTARLAEALGVEPAKPAAGGSTTDLPLEGRADALAMLDEELNALGSRAGTLAESLDQLDDAWQEREKVLASTPNVMPVRGFFSDGFGWRKDPFSGRREFHEGLDIVAPPGAVVRAPADGIVTRTMRTPGYGKMAEIAHGYGYRTRYGHLSEFLVNPGQPVHRGDPIGRVGSTGRSTGPHLHYEVHKEGRKVNPWRYLGDRKG